MNRTHLRWSIFFFFAHGQSGMRWYPCSDTVVCWVTVMRNFSLTFIKSQRQRLAGRIDRSPRVAEGTTGPAAIRRCNGAAMELRGHWMG